MTLISRFFSRIFHPLVMPMYAILAMLFATPLGQILPVRVVAFLLVGTFVSTFVFPILFVFGLYKLGRISSFSMRERKERIQPLLFGVLMCYFNYKLLAPTAVWVPLFSKLFLLLAIFLFLLTLITFFWKISLHMSAIGGLLVILIYFSSYAWLPILMVFFSGLLGTSRLWLKAHSSLQVYTGFCLGFSYFWISLLLLS